MTTLWTCIVTCYEYANQLHVCTTTLKSCAHMYVDTSGILIFKLAPGPTCTIINAMIILIISVVQYWYNYLTWWRHQMEAFSALLALCAGNSPITGEFPAQRPVTRSFDVFFDLRLNKPLCKQSWGWWFETPSRSLWRHCNVWIRLYIILHRTHGTGVFHCIHGYVLWNFQCI